MTDQKVTPPHKADAAGAGAEQAPQVAPPRSFKQRFVRFVIALVLVTGLLFFFYRYLGTSTYRGTVQRVYEKEAFYRAEFVDAEGEVHVVANEDIRFPHFKVDTADLQAELHRYSETGDVVDITVWGFRFSWFSIFPNVVGVEFVRSDEAKRAAQIKRLTTAVVNELVETGVVKRGPSAEALRPGLEQALEKTMKQPPANDAAESSPEEK